MNSTVQKSLLYILMPLFWLVLLVIFLYSPYAEQFLSRYHKSITIFVWSDIVDSTVIKNFERETGIKVYVNYYEGNDELLTKLEFSDGAGYDIIMPTHYMIEPLRQRGFLKKIDKSKLNFWDQLDPHLLNLYYDPQNAYSIPYLWEFYGLGINNNFFTGKKIENSWQMLFDPAYTYRVGMTDEPREILNVAGFYLFGQLKQFDELQLERIKNLLRKQKKFVDAYTDLNSDFLLTSKSAAVVFLPISSFYRARQRVDWVNFLLPKEGSLMTIENFAITAKSDKEDLAYIFINYLFKDYAVKQVCEYYGYLPTLKNLLYAMDVAGVPPIDYIFDSYFTKLSLVRLLFSRQQMSQIWLAVKA